MGTRKCCIKDCDSVDGEESQKNGITFHRFPQTNQESASKWIKACNLESGFKPSKHHFVCSKHFRRENFTILASSKKVILKSFTVPSIFPWNKDTVVVTKSTISLSDPESPDKKKKTEKSMDDSIKSDKSKSSQDTVTDESSSAATTSLNKEKEDAKEMLVPKEEKTTPKTDSSKKKGSTVKKKESITSPPIVTAAAVQTTPEKPKKSSKRLSERYQQAEIQAKKAKTVQSEEKQKVKSEPQEQEPALLIPKTEPVETPSTPKKKNQIVNFVPGNLIEAQNFDGKWVPAKIIEVDMDDREVLVRSGEKNSKSKITDEWISMDSPRLRPAQPTVTFEVGEKVLARWNDCRKFPATIQRVLENDSYDILFDDGYPKIVRGIHIHKYNSKSSSKTQVTEVVMPQVINPLLLNPPSLIPDYIKEMKDELPKAPTEGEWCCVWVDDIPVGEESTFDGKHGKLPSIIIHDWRLKEGWQKHIYLRQNGKWDVIFISPTSRQIRFKNELRNYLNEIGEAYDPNVWDFSLHKKLSKARNLCIQSNKTQLTNSFEVNSDGASKNPFANLGALPYVQPNLVQAPPQQTEVSVGSLKVKVIDNNYYCPAEKCDKIYRKENVLQIHIKHYHEDLAKLMGECPNMEDLAYMRTTIDETEMTMVKSNRKSHGPKEPKLKSSKNEMMDSLKEVQIKLEKIPLDSKFNVQRSPILEEALKAPLITSQVPTIKKEESDANTSALINQFDPETLIPPHALVRPNIKAHHARRKMKIRFNPKPKKSGQKKRQFGYFPGDIGSTVEGVIPYHEGPYFKSQQPSNYVDENGEIIKIVRMKKEEIINCVCGFGEEDGLMIQCDLCLCWQHGVCHGIENSTQVPEKHVCFICKNPYRQRTSTRFIHDQDWLYDGKLPIASYHVENPKQPARFNNLKQCHTLIGNLIELKKYMSSLDVKINIAENSEHPKLYLWAKKWEESPPREKEDSKDDVKLEEVDVKMPVAPVPEAAIEPRKCQQTLLDHIQFQQNSLKSRLDNIESEINALEEDATSKVSNGKKPVSDSTLKETIYMLIKDLKQMNEFADIHRNPIQEELL